MSSLFPNTYNINLYEDSGILKEQRSGINPDDETEDDISDLIAYRNGGEGLVKWAEENVRVPIQYGDSAVEAWVYLGEMPDRKHPETGRSFKYFWEKQKEQLVRALEMHNGHFIHRLIVFNEPRGDGKSYRAVLVQTWKFFCFTKQQIVFGANSKEQTKFVHFTTASNMILNSPKLVDQLGKKNIQDKEIRMKNSRGEIVSFMKPISTMQGIVSNITGYTFSEMFKMKNTTFFTELHGSIRNIPNALGVIDTTVSTREHKLYDLYKVWVQKKDPTLFYCYRSSKNADPKDYWHPNQTQKQLDSYKTIFDPLDFDRFFRNTWEAGDAAVISPLMIKALNVVGINGKICDGAEIISHLSKIKKAEDILEQNDLNNDHSSDRLLKSRITFLKMPINYIDSIYSLEKEGVPSFCSLDELKKLSNLYNTNWAIGASVDRADPLKKTNDGARSIVTITAKGLYNSRTMDAQRILDIEKNPLYIYIVLYIAHVPSSDIELIKEEILKGVDEYDGVDILCSERWGMWDMKSWCDSQGIIFDPIYPTYSIQRDAFREVFTVLSQGRVKCAVVHVPGSKGPDILREEMELFTHDTEKKWYGSPQKNDPMGIQDDAMYSFAYSIYGMRNISVLDFRERVVQSAFAQYYPK